MGAIAPAASAINLVPAQEGEINVGLGSSVDSKGYLDTTPLGYMIESLEFTTRKGNADLTTRSRLFVDQAGTSNKYGGGFSFQSRDIGTSDQNRAFWFRPASTLLTSNGGLIEKGQLEVGRFLFTFQQPMESLLLSFFDVEATGTSVLKINGQDFNQAIAPGSNNSQRQVTLNNVQTLELMLGNANTGSRNATGDGVLLQASGQPVPEPASMLGIAAAGAGIAAIRRRKNAQTAS